MWKNYMSFQKRFVLYFILAVILGFSLACQSVTRILSEELPASNKTPEFPINSTGYDGNWKGTTSQGFEVTFSVVHNGITALKVQGNWEGQNCSRNFETNIEVNINPTAEALGIPPT